jgi:putative flippase GtrA
MITAYILVKLFVFRKNNQSTHKSIIYFCLVNVLSVAQTWAVSMGMAYYILPGIGVAFLVPEIAHFIGLAVPAFTSFVGYKHLSFREAKEEMA